MPEIFNKSEHGLTNIIIAWDEFNPVFHPDDEFLPYNMPEIFNKSGHGLTNIIIAWDEFNPVFHPQFFGNNGTYIYCVLECKWRPSTMVGACVKNFSKSNCII